MKLLYICAGAIINRGVERYILNVVSGFSEDIIVDILTPIKCFNEEFRHKIVKRGGKIIEFDLQHIRRNLYLNYIVKLKCFLKQNSYDIVEVHTGDIPLLGLTAFISSFFSIKRIILHTHNTHTSGKGHYVERLLFTGFMKKATDFWACSMKAGYDTFPSSVVNDIIWIPNAIDIGKFLYNEDMRCMLRKKMHLDNKIVIGHIGAFEKQKNHSFLIDVFAEVCNISEDYVLLLIGTGSLLKRIKDKVTVLHLEEKVLFYDVSDKVNDLLNALDLFVLPSIWEGLGIVAIEAQTNGLPCLLSDALPDEAIVSKNCKKLSVTKDSVSLWAESIIKADYKIDRIKNYEQVQISKYQLTYLSKLVMENYKESV